MKNNSAQATKSLPRMCHYLWLIKSTRWPPGWNDPGGWVIKQALSAWLAQEEERNRLTLEALDDVTSGQVIDHQAVQTWADSLNTDNPLPVPR